MPSQRFLPEQFDWCDAGWQKPFGLRLAATSATARQPTMQLATTAQLI